MLIFFYGHNSAISTLRYKIIYERDKLQRKWINSMAW